MELTDTTRDGNSGAGGKESWLQKLEKMEVSKVVRSELGLEAVFGSAFGYTHDTNAVSKEPRDIEKGLFQLTQRC